jgi:hypothetical protein
VIDGPTRGRPWASDAARAQLRRVAAKASVLSRPGSRTGTARVELQHCRGILLGGGAPGFASASAGGVVCQQLGGVVVHDAARDLLGKVERVELAE